MKVKRIFVAIFLLVFIAEGYSQNEICNEWTLQERRALAVEWRDAIASSGLVVVMVSNNRQLNYLEEQLQSARQEGAEKREKKISKEIEEMRSRTQEKAQETMDAFHSNYNFSQVYFVWDYDMRYVLHQSDSAVFLAEDFSYLEKSPFQPEDEVFFLVRGRADRSSGRSGMEGFLIRNKELNPLCSPFPFFLARNENNFFNAIFSIFNPDLYSERPMKQVAERFNASFRDF